MIARFRGVVVAKTLAFAELGGGIGEGWPSNEQAGRDGALPGGGGACRRLRGWPISSVSRLARDRRPRGQVRGRTPRALRGTRRTGTNAAGATDRGRGQGRGLEVVGGEGDTIVRVERNRRDTSTAEGTIGPAAVRTRLPLLLLLPLPPPSQYRSDGMRAR